MIVYKCDKCEREMVSPKYIYFPVSDEWSHEVIGGICYQKFMICDRCLTSFAEWLGSDTLFNFYRDLETGKFNYKYNLKDY